MALDFRIHIRSKGRQNKPGRGFRSFLLPGIKNLMLYAIFLLYPAREGFFCGVAAAGLPVPDFPCFVFGGGFLAECRHPRGNGHGCPFQSDAARMPLEDDRSPWHTFPFCLETTSRKKCTENRDRQSRCRRPVKESLPCVRPRYP